MPSPPRADGQGAGRGQQGCGAGQSAGGPGAKVKASAQESGQSLPDDVTLRKQALDRLIQESLQLQLAERQGLKISDTQLEQAIQSIAADNKMNLEQLRAQLEREGLTYAQYREEVRRGS